MPKFTAENAAEHGRKGGRATVERHGRGHMSTIGARGFWTTVRRHWGGDARAFVNYLIALGLAATDPVPQNGAFDHDRARLRERARQGTLAYLRPHWQPRSRPEAGATSRDTNRSYPSAHAEPTTAQLARREQPLCELP